MKTVIVGIDLGTTNSVIAIPGQFPDHGIVFGNVTVLWDEFERLTHASAVCRQNGELTVGDDAKALASEGFAPVRFVKKYMGTRNSFRVGSDEQTPEEISAEILKHLCAFAAKSLGVQVVGAVITHPAYFDGLAIQATQRAGELAGLKVAGLLMEPVAAAMAYCADDPHPQMRVLVYDLGGGTFDITLVERNGSSFMPIGFGGDRELGGYNIDKKIAIAMLNSLREKGYTITIDPQRPEIDTRWATLMHYAEKLKCQLSDKDATKGTVRVPSVFTDDTGRSVQLNFSMSSQQFVELIEPEIHKTIRATRDVLNNAGVRPDEVSRLVMVGGSSRIYAIQKRLQDEFGLEPQFDDDVLDLSVAVGAAMVAAAAGTSDNGVTLAGIPEETDECIAIFAGTVASRDDLPQVSNLAVSVRGGAMGEQTTLTSAEGKFLLEVELRENADNELHFAVRRPDGTALSERVFHVRHGHDSAPPPQAPKEILPKPISVETISGFSLLAAEGVLLPFKGQKSFQTLREVTEIPVNIFQDDLQLTTILLTGFAQPVPPNCRVELEIEIGRDYQMIATASVPSANLRKSQPVKLQPLVLPTIEELRADFRAVRAAFDSQMENTPESEQKARLGAEAEIIIEETESILASEFPELLQGLFLVKKLFLLTKQLATSGGLSPPKSEVDAKLNSAREHLSKAIAKRATMREQNYDQILEALQEESTRAYQRSDGITWRQINDKLDEIIATLEAAQRDSGPSLDEFPVVMILAWLNQQIDATEQQAAVKASGGGLAPADFTRCQSELQTARSKAKEVNMADERAAKQQLIVIYQQHVRTAEQIASIVSNDPLGPVIREI